jgi:hypothetical protein
MPQHRHGRRAVGRIALRVLGAGSRLREDRLQRVASGGVEVARDRGQRCPRPGQATAEAVDHGEGERLGVGRGRFRVATGSHGDRLEDRSERLTAGSG